MADALADIGFLSEKFLPTQIFRGNQKVHRLESIVPENWPVEIRVQVRSHHIASCRHSYWALQPCSRAFMHSFLPPVSISHWRYAASS